MNAGIKYQFFSVNIFGYNIYRMIINQCSLCGSPGTNKSTCPLNPKCHHPNYSKHIRSGNLSRQKYQQNGGLLGGQCINFLDLALQAINQMVAIENFCEVTLQRVDNNTITQPICCSPLALVLESKKSIAQTTTINNRVVLITTADNTQFIYKNDEQQHANELSFVANILQCHFNMFSPRIALVHFNIGEQIVVAQAIEYFEGLKNLDLNEVNQLPDAPEQLAICASFSFFLADFDNFNFAGKVVDNNYFSSRDPEFEPTPLNELFQENNTPLNEGNIAIVNGKIILIDIRPNTDTEFRQVAHEIALNGATLISSLFATFFEPNEANRASFQARFEKAFIKHCREQFMYEPILEQLIEWASVYETND